MFRNSSDFKQVVQFEFHMANILWWNLYS